MKHFLLLIAAIVLSIATVVCKIWAIISFIIYLVKDEPFNWLSLWIGLSCLTALIIVYIGSMVNPKEKESQLAPLNFNDRPKSKFAQRLEEAHRLQSERSKDK